MSASNDTKVAPSSSKSLYRQAYGASELPRLHSASDGGLSAPYEQRQNQAEAGIQTTHVSNVGTDGGVARFLGDPICVYVL